MLSGLWTTHPVPGLVATVNTTPAACAAAWAPKLLLAMYSSRARGWFPSGPGAWSPIASGLGPVVNPPDHIRGRRPPGIPGESGAVTAAARGSFSLDLLLISLSPKGKSSPWRLPPRWPPNRPGPRLPRLIGVATPQYQKRVRVVMNGQSCAGGGCLVLY